MSEDLIQLPEISEIQELLTVTKADLNNEIKENPELVPSSQLLFQLIDIIEEKIGNQKDFSKLTPKQKIDLAAHLTFLQNLIEDFFFDDEFDFDEELDFDDEMEIELDEKD